MLDGYGDQLALIEVAGEHRKVNIGMLPEETFGPGDWVIIHMGFVVEKTDKAGAAEALAGLELLRSGNDDGYTSGWEAFAAYAYPPNELGYCGPPDPSVLLAGRGTDVAEHAQGFDGAWPYWRSRRGRRDCGPARCRRGARLLGGRPLLDRVDAAALLARLRRAMSGQPCGLLADVTAGPRGAGQPQLPCVRRLPVGAVSRRRPGHPAADPAGVPDPFRGTVDSVDDEHAVIASRPLVFDAGELRLGERSTKPCGGGLPTVPRSHPDPRRVPRSPRTGTGSVGSLDGNDVDGAGRGHRVDARGGQPAARAVTSRYSHSIVDVPAGEAVAEFGQRRIQGGDALGLVGDAAVDGDRGAVVGLEVVAELRAVGEPVDGQGPLRARPRR